MHTLMGTQARRRLTGVLTGAQRGRDVCLLDVCGRQLAGLHLRRPRHRQALGVREKRVTALEHELWIQQTQRQLTTVQALLLALQRSLQDTRQLVFQNPQPVASLLRAQQPAGLQPMLQAAELLLVLTTVELGSTAFSTASTAEASSRLSAATSAVAASRTSSLYRNKSKSVRH